MSGRELIARDRLPPAEVGVYRMEVQAVLAWNERESLVQVLAQFTKRARLAGVVASSLNAAAAERPAFLPCQQCREMGIDSSLFRAASVSTPQEA